MKASTIAVIGAVSAAALIPVAAAHASFGMPSLLTVSPREQADEVSSAALAGDGRYLVFAGSLDGAKGILRRDLQTGVVEPVAATDAYGSSPVRDAASPAISANGRYVSFTTSAALDPADDHNQQPDVYVRDMDASVPGDGAPCGAYGPCAYTLVSALDGTTAGLTYATGSASGSTAAARQAISADGRRVAFIVVAESDLAGPATPGGQVAVRDLDTRRTVLVSALRDPDTGAMTDRPVPGRAVVEQGPRSAPMAPPSPGRVSGSAYRPRRSAAILAAVPAATTTSPCGGASPTDRRHPPAAWRARATRRRPAVHLAGRWPTAPVRAFSAAQHRQPRAGDHRRLVDRDQRHRCWR